ncbi:hypothetical protein Tdes44962_MAKER07164 [Teratosphaeria destructans]|uniref:Uncharacterized protein n=1 Tax=Teratosphaeria destructans TaxID=418781 RepID=A0A9W7T085_9PEZI|nr:hypothetical protein Tdes44962_MAKER07164 [Teratosphaeria destructans]
MPSLDIFKAIFFPALIALALYALLSFALLPLWRAHRARYSQYIPLDSLSQRTESLRDSWKRRLLEWVLPRSMRWRRDGGMEGEVVVFGDEEGERMVGFGATASNVVGTTFSRYTMIDQRTGIEAYVAPYDPTQNSGTHCYHEYIDPAESPFSSNNPDERFIGAVDGELVKEWNPANFGSSTEQVRC